jgi:hypothetical protein
MAGTLTISTLSDGTNSTSSTNCIQGSAKAWVSFNGANAPSIKASYNVSSVTWNSNADYTINFTNAFVDTKYAFGGNVERLDNNTNGIGGWYAKLNGISTSSLRIFASWYDGAGTIFPTVCVSCFR